MPPAECPCVSSWHYAQGTQRQEATSPLDRSLPVPQFKLRTTFSAGSGTGVRGLGSDTEGGINEKERYAKSWADLRIRQWLIWLLVLGAPVVGMVLILLLQGLFGLGFFGGATRCLDGKSRRLVICPLRLGV